MKNKYIITADVYEYFKQYSREEISFSRFVELINEKVDENIKKRTSKN
jgi:predicted CopG family antitoxin